MTKHMIKPNEATNGQGFDFTTNFNGRGEFVHKNKYTVVSPERLIRHLEERCGANEIRINRLLAENKEQKQVLMTTIVIICLLAIGGICLIV